MDPGAELVLNLLICSVFGAITAAIAVSKGRHGVGWFFVGFFTTCIGLIVILCMSNLTEERERWEKANRETRRLREQLKQERFKGEAFRGHVKQRLDVHDAELGVDTRSLGGAEQELASLDHDSAQVDFPDPRSFHDAEWYVEIDSKSSDVLSFQQLRRIYREGRIDENSLVLTSEMRDWKRILDVPGLLEKLL